MTTPKERPGLQDGVQREFFILAKIKPGEEQVIRDKAAWSQGADRRPAAREGIREVGTVHNYRWVFLNDDTVLFASVFDGDWDAYIDDFGASPKFTEAFDFGLEHVEGYPGMADPNVKDWWDSHQISAATFYSAYPDLTVQQILKQQRAYDALQGVLDSAEFQAAVEDPAYAKLVATPAFQKLLDEAAG